MGYPFFILTHRTDDEPSDAGFTFVSGLESAMQQARAVAGDKDIGIMGGADTIRQALAAGYVDELFVTIAPVVLGGGKRLFEGSTAVSTCSRWTYVSRSGPRTCATGSRSNGSAARIRQDVRMGAHDEGGTLPSADRAAWRDWLASHHESSTGVWFVSWRKHAARNGPRYEDAVEEALCFGWIDSIGRKLDDDRTMLWFSPRKGGSGWARPNKERVERLTAAGLMTASGQRVIDAAIADGSWSRLDDVDNLVVPDDLARPRQPSAGSRTLGRVPALGSPQHPGMDRAGQARHHESGTDRGDRSAGATERTRQPVAAQGKA